VRSTMQDVPLTVPALVATARSRHGRLPVSTLLTSSDTSGEAVPVTGSLSAVLDDAQRLVSALHGLGIRGDARVATLARNTPAHLAAYLGVPSMGAVLHPVNIRLPTEDIGGILDAAGDEVALVDAQLLPALAPLLARRPALRHVVVLDDLLPPATGAPPTARNPPELPIIAGVAVHDGRQLLDAADVGFGGDLMAAACPDERDAAALCFTSGSTGRPRGVAYSHRSIYLHSYGIAAGDAFAFGPADTVLPVVPMFHVLAWGLPYACLLIGAGIALPGPHGDPVALLKLAEAAGVTHAAGVPTVFARMLAYLRTDPTWRFPPTLRELLVGGAPVPPTLVDEFAARGVAVRHAWGMTETSPLGSVARADPRTDAQTARAQQLSQGRLASSVNGRVVGPDGAVLPADGVSVGELEVRGPWVSERYLDEPADTTRAWLPTGDLATLDADGFLTVVDRVSDLVKSGGEWISPRRIEALLETVPAVAEATVVAVDDDIWGQRPAGVLVLVAGDPAPEPEVLTAAVVAGLPAWQVPDSWWTVGELPRGGTGKVDRAAVAAAVVAGTLSPLTNRRPVAPGRRGPLP
jgi:fatty-acyl-CoA synthase